MCCVLKEAFPTLADLRQGWPSTSKRKKPWDAFACHGFCISTLESSLLPAEFRSEGQAGEQDVFIDDDRATGLADVVGC